MRTPLPRPLHAAHSRAAVRRLLGWLILALLLAPTLGRIHQVVHPAAWHGAGDHAHVHSVQALPGQGASSQLTPGHWLLALFSGHSHSDCQLHDQLNALASPPLAGPLFPDILPRDLPRHEAQRSVFAGSAAFFDPRAPPAAAA